MHKRRWEERPRDATLGDPLFLAASTMGDYETMAAVSRKLFNQTKLSIWARMAAYSTYCQALPSAPAPPSSSSAPAFAGEGAAFGAEAAFPLCPEKSLVAASLFLKTLPSAEESVDVFWLRLAVLIGGREFGEARALVQRDGHSGALARRWVSMQAAAAIAAYDRDARASVWADEFETAAALLRADREAQSNYAFYRHAVDAVLLGGVDAGKAQSLFAELRESVPDRSPALALLELDARLRASGKGMGEAESKAALESYLDRWGCKWTAGPEVAGVSAGREAVADEVMAARAQRFAEHSSEKEFVALAVAELYALRRREGGSAEEARRLWGIYEAGLPYGANLPKTDVQPADAVGLGAVEHLVRVWQAAPADPAPLQGAAVLLETVVANSPSAAGARLALVRVYRLLGAPGLAAPHADKLKLSEVQLDALGWVFERADDLRALQAQAGAWADFAGKAEAMYARSRADLPQYITHALEHESYSKVGTGARQGGGRMALTAQIRGIQQLVGSLDRSVGQVSLDAELVLRDLARGASVDAGAVKRLARAADSTSELPCPCAELTAAPLADNRVYDLTPASLASAQAPGGAQALARALVPIASYCAGDESRLDAAVPEPAGSDALAAALAHVARALRVAVKEDGDAAPLSAAFSPALSRAQAATLVGVCDAVAARATDVLPTGKKKKNKNGQLRKARLFELRDALRAARELVPAASTAGEAEWAWAPSPGLGDEERRAELGTAVAAARAELAAALDAALKPK